MAGRVFERNGTWYIAWYVRGVEYKRSAHTPSRAIAEKLLLREIRKSGTGHVPTEDKLTFQGLIEKVRLDRDDRGRRCHDLDQRAVHLRLFFGDMRAVDITTDHIKQYRQSRKRAKAEQSTINRELAVLRRGFNLSELSHTPKFEFPKENNARQDFLDKAGFQAVRAELPEWARDPISFMYLSSWRQAQVVALEWRDIDMKNKVVTARKETTKSGEPHRIALVGELWEIIERAHAHRRLDCATIFHRDGEPFLLRGGKAPLRVAWNAACAAAGFSGHVLHCLRRSGIRNMIGAGLDPMKAMKISGHKSFSMLARYNIIDIDDIKQGLEQTMTYLAEQPSESKVRAIGGKP